MTEEEAKAIQELAKATGKGLEIIEALGSFLKIIFADPAIEIGGILTDRLKAYRYVQLFKIADKINTSLKNRGIEGGLKPIPLRLSIPIIEEASLESEDSIQDLWAGLIANAIDPDINFRINRIYIDILSRLEPLDARIINALSLIESSDPFGLWKRVSEEVGEISDYDFQISLGNLSRLGLLLAQGGTIFDGAPPSSATGVQLYNSENIKLYLSPLAFSLTEACKQ